MIIGIILIWFVACVVVGIGKVIISPKPPKEWTRKELDIYYRLTLAERRALFEPEVESVPLAPVEIIEILPPAPIEVIEKYYALNEQLQGNARLISALENAIKYEDNAIKAARLQKRIADLSYSNVLIGERITKILNNYDIEE